VERFLKPSEVAQALGVSRSTAYQLIREGKLPHVLIAGRIRRVPARALEELAERAIAEAGSR
jgi:excisionase family DNA binding protein